MRRFSFAMACFLMLTLLPACAPTQGTPADSGAPQSQAKETVAGETHAPADGTTAPAGSAAPADAPASEEPKFEDIVFPEQLPDKVIMAEENLYGYDDMTERYDIEILMTNYGAAALDPKEDPINQWMSKRFNMDIRLTAIAGLDLETTVSTRAAANDWPDILMLSKREQGFAFSDQGLLVDAKNIYPYMKHSNNYTTSFMVKWSTNPTNGEIPFITKYSIQDGNVWGLAARTDWLKKLNMQMPTTKEQLMEYAKACTFNDPDGNGKNDTWFTSAAGAGKAWGMLGPFEHMFGDPSAYAKDGQLQHPLFNGVRKSVLSFFKELNDAGVLAPDWFTMDWDQNVALVNNDKVGMVFFPVAALYSSYAAEGKSRSIEALEVWDFLKQPPIEGGKFAPAGNPGFMWSLPTMKYEKDGALDMGKVKRMAHFIDSMTLGNENFFHSVQGSTGDVFKEAGITPETERITKYTDDGMFYLWNEDKFPYRKDDKYWALNSWQQFGLCVSYQVDYPDSPEAYAAAQAKKTAPLIKLVNNELPRWPNNGLLVTLSGEAAESSISMADWTMAQEYAFVTGKRSFDEWDAYCKEVLDKGGRLAIEQMCEQLNVPVPEYAKQATEAK